MLQNASLLAIVAVDTAENEPSEVSQRSCGSAPRPSDRDPAPRLPLRRRRARGGKEERGRAEEANPL